MISRTWLPAFSVWRIMDILISLLHKNNTTWIRDYVTAFAALWQTYCPGAELAHYL